MQRPTDLILRAQADLAIQIERPAPCDLIIRKIGRMHIMPCAAKSYIDTYGMPTAKREISERPSHRDDVRGSGERARILRRDVSEPVHIGFMAMRTNVSTALYAAIVNGLAVGWLPTYYFAIGTPVIPLNIDWIYSFDIFLSYHRDLGEVPRIRRMIDWASHIRFAKLSVVSG